MTFGRELVVLLTKSSMFVKFLMHVWRSCGGLNNEHFYINSLRVKLILAPIEYMWLLPLGFYYTILIYLGRSFSLLKIDYIIF